MMEFSKYITLTREEFETIPGRGVTKKPAYYRGQIIALLEEAGVEGYGVYDGNIVFMKKFEVADGVTREIRFSIRPVLIQVKTRRKGGKTENVPHPATSWYLLWKLMEAKIAAIKVGITEVMDEFMPHIAMIGKDGEETTFGEVLKVLIEADRLNEIPQLEVS